MTACPRCGTGLLSTATVCTACCHVLTAQAPEPIPAAVIDVTPPVVDVIDPAPSAATPTEPVTAPAEEPDSNPRAALNHWPFGGADAETVAAVTEATSHETRPQLTDAAQTASGSLRGELAIPNQRTAAFHPLHVSAKPIPPNPYLAAERRQYARLRAAAAHDSEV